MKLSEAIHDYLLRHELGRNELAELAGVSRITLANYAKDKVKSPDLQALSENLPERLEDLGGGFYQWRDKKTGKLVEPLTGWVDTTTVKELLACDLSTVYNYRTRGWLGQVRQVGKSPYYELEKVKKVAEERNPWGRQPKSITGRKGKKPGRKPNASARKTS